MLCNRDISLSKLVSRFSIVGIFGESIDYRTYVFGLSLVEKALFN